MGLNTESNFKNVIYRGDNLEVLKRLPDKSIDLIYIDPPFFSDREYKTDFKGSGETRGFLDSWEDGRRGYLDFITSRLLECHRVLKDTGAFYFHCDWHASHYVKVELDKIFGDNNFRNEIVWHYRTGGVSKQWFSRKHDVIFFYVKTKKHKFNPIEVKEYYKDIYGPGFKPGWEDRKGGKDMRGYFHMVYMDDVWNIPAVFNMSEESLGYPTQKPEELLDRIIRASSKEGDIILDPFCGSGTTLAVAEKNKRKWIGIDLSLTACELTRKRLVKLGVQDLVILGGLIKEGDFKNLSDTEFKNWLLRKINYKIKSSDNNKIDGVAFGYIPIRIERKDKIESNEMLEFINYIKTKESKKGIFVGLSFSNDAEKIVKNTKDVEIKMVSLKDLLETNIMVW